MRDTQAAIASVRRRMAEQDLPIGQLARKAGVSENTVRSFLEGRRWPNMVSAGKLERALDWPPGHIEDLAIGAIPQESSPNGTAPHDPPVPIEVVIDGTRIVIHPNPGYTPEQVRQQAREIFDAAMERLAQMKADGEL